MKPRPTLIPGRKPLKILQSLVAMFRVSALLLIMLHAFVKGYATGDDGIETKYSVVLAGSPLVSNSTPLIVTGTATLTYTAQNELSKKIQNIITLSLFEETPDYITNDFTASVQVLIEYGQSAGTAQSIVQTLEVTYTKAEGSKYNARQYFHFEGAEYVKVTVQAINAPQLGTYDTKALLILTHEMRVTRYYELANNVQPVSFSATAPVAGDDEMQVTWSWPSNAGNTHTQLEWTWLEDDFVSTYDNGSGMNYTLLFRNNSTRIELPYSVNTYKIPILYPGQGKIYCRIRAVNIKKTGNRSDGPWSTPQFAAFGGHNNDLNWQATISFAEDGKRKAVIQYYDGSLRSRQVVTKDNTTNTVIAAETFYDAQGRPAVQVLPAPTTATKMAYTPGLNLFKQNSELNVADQTLSDDPTVWFDLQPIATPTNITPALNTTSGAANYYSASNPEKNIGHNKFIPDAEGYPYTVTRYTQDGTGRISAQSSPGAALQMGKGHEKKYFYGTVAQEELDGLFGTEAGNYTHYFKTMVRDANGQMSVSYSDMHGRTVATALAGDPLPNLQALDLNSTDYPNQAGTNITRNLLDNNSNVVKNFSVESVNSLLVPAGGTYHFEYELNPQVLQLEDCSEQPICYDCMYDLTISITDESGDNEPIVKKFSNVTLTPDDNCATAISSFKEDGTGPPSNFIEIEEYLPPGSYTVRKTLTVSQSSLQKYKELFLTKGLCKTEQQLIDSVYTALLAVSDCDDPPSSNTCADCLAQLGSFSNFQTNYLNSLGNPNPVPDHVALEIQAAFNAAKSNCDRLCGTVSQKLSLKRQLMLADMIPFSGQYAQSSGSGYVYNTYNIFSTASPTTQPFYKKPWNSSQAPDYYRTVIGQIDPVIHPDGSSTLLLSTTPQQFAEKFVNSWAEALLPHHPEYAKLKFAETELAVSYNWINDFTNTSTYADASSKGYIFTSSGNLNDPFYTEAPSYKSNMVTWVTSNYRNNLSLWQIAYGDVACKTILDPGQRGSCYTTAPKVPPYNSLHISPFTTLTAAQKDQIWLIFRNLYASERDNQVNAYIAASVSFPDAQTLVNAGYLLHFPTSNNQMAQQYGPDWSWYPATPGGAPDASNIPGGNTPAAVYASRCESYIELWKRTLEQCPALASHVNKAQILNEITAAMVLVCQKGSNESNPYGSSEVPPSWPNDGMPRSFEEIIDAKLAAYGISRNNLCNPFVIEFPKAYGKGPKFTEQYVTAIDTCHCSRFEQLKLEATAAGKNTAVLSSFNEYLSAAYGETLTQGLFNSLTQGCPNINTTACYDTVLRVSIGCSTPIPCNCVAAPPSGGVCYVDCQQKICNTINPYPLDSAEVLPGFLSCGAIAAPKCLSCADLSALVADFKDEFDSPWDAGPVFTGSDLSETDIQKNILFAQYVNYKKGFQFNWVDYARAAAEASPVCNLANYASNGSATQNVICRDDAPLNENDGIFDEESPCQHVADMAVAIGQQIYQQRKEQLLADFEKEYLKKCLAAKDIEQFTVKYSSKEYHYTLYYYDLAGSLVKTVPPRAVHPDFSTTFTNNVKAARANGTVLRPSHVEALSTNYRYNSLGQVIAQKTPDAGISKFWYDKLGRLVVSQNAQQAADAKYSYTLYDPLGRIVEVGQKPQGTAMTQTISQDPVALNNWILVNGGTREQITFTVYDLPYLQSPLYPNGVLYGTELTQRNLRNRVSYTGTKNLATDADHYTATFYTYDIHGNVDTLLQDYKGIPEMSTTNNRFKRIVYDFDLVSGKVNMVSYHPDRIDPQTGLLITSNEKFFHKYVYDAENRLTTVWTSRDKIYWERDAAYWYYKHGPLARMELGHLRVQGVDYAYTLQGWLKGVNTTALDDGSKDMGQDGYSSGPNSNVARDVLGFALHYFDEVDGSDTWLDYTAINGTSAFARPDASTGFKSLYNGNIGAISMNNAGLLKGAGPNTYAAPLFYKYRYDQLNRLVSMQAYEGLNAATNQWTAISINDYAEAITYDPNGNIKTYNRKGSPKAGQPLEMDALTYLYETDKNRLSYVQDPTPAGNYSQAANGTVDIDGQSAGNYGYDANGNLTSDVAENISAVSWNVYGKITSVTKGSGTIVYSYDAAGNRIIKAVGSTTTIYVRDVGGNVVSLYEKPTNGSIQQKELHLYGSKRIGIEVPQLAAPSNVSLSVGFGMATKVVFVRNIKAFELSNHLSSVLVTVSDKKIGVESDNNGTVDYYEADVISAQDMYSFGMIMPGRSYNAGNYRYGFGGQEMSNEIKGVGNSYTAEYWEYDPRIGRRWNVDPVTKEWESPYAAFNNNPIFYNDPKGLDGEDPQKYKVQKGDNLTKIAKKYNTTVDNLVSWNNIKDPNKINVNQLLIVSDPTPKPPSVTYESLAKKDPSIPLAVSGATSTALSLYTGRYNTYGSVSSDVMNNLTEEQKQKDFATNSPKTTAILLWEFVTGTGSAHRSFNQSHAITQEIMYSESARQAIWAMVGDFQKGKYKDGETRGYYAPMAPDKGIGVFESIRRHANAYMTTPATFYRGGMYFRMTKQGNNIIVKVTDAYSVASMITRNAADNISRVPGKATPLGTTSVEFNFTWENVNFNAQRKQ